MWNWISKWPEDIAGGYEKTMKAQVPVAEHIAIWGMGGSGIMGRIMTDISGEIGRKPVFSGGGYAVPSWIDDKTLFIPVSYSGNTEETLDSFDMAAEKKAKIISLASGGKLMEKSVERNILCLDMQKNRPPRANLPQMIGMGTAICEKSGVFPSMRENIRKASLSVEKLFDERTDEIKDLAALTAKDNIFIVSPEKVKSAASRWACQINENAKKRAEALWLPEMNHNFVVGGIPENSSLIYLIQNCSDLAKDSVRRRATSDLFRDFSQDFKPFEVHFEGEDYFSSYMESLAFGDIYSLFLAEILGVDPLPIEAIDRLKSFMSRGEKN
ncbi:SIS domain-containing protein [candidate division WOR-3 bacterium]|nr:SIS domain-containing protein [candidate division WOR-3 bacterium]